MIDANIIGDADMPDRSSESSSSIGEIGWPPVESSFDRFKTIDNSLIEDEDTLSYRLKYIEEFNLQSGGRITARIFVRDDVLSALKGNPFIESIIPLRGCGIPELEDCSIVYIGKNSPDRSPEVTHQLRGQRAKAETIFNSPVKKVELNNDRFSVIKMKKGDVSNELRGLGISDDLIADLSNRIKQEYIELLKIFDWTEDQCEELIQNSDIYICLDRNVLLGYSNDLEPLVVGSGIVEFADIDISVGDKTILFRMAEMTEAVTHPGLGGNGIYKMVTRKQLDDLSGTGVNLVYGECNASSPAVLRVAHSNGRQLSDKNGLPAHVTIGGSHQNFIPVFIPRSGLVRMYGSNTEES